MNRIVCLSLMCAVILCLADGCATSPEGRGKSHWNDRTLALLAIEPCADYGVDADPNQWWDDLISALNIEFWRLCYLEDHEEHLRRLINQFGKHGPMVDMRLCIADAPVMFPQDWDRPAEPFLKAGRPELRRIEEEYRAIQNLVSKIQVEMFLENPNALERYYDALIWSHQFLRYGENEWRSLISKFVGLDEFWCRFDGGDADYWWYAREFVLLAHATGRDDLLRDVDPTDLYSRYEKWDEWMDTNIWGEAGWTRLFPHSEKPIWVERDSILAQGRPLVREPVLPFPDWDPKVLPPPPKAHLLYFLFSPSSFFFGDRMPWSEDYAGCGKSDGITSHAAELPYFGKAISEFPTEGEIVYASLDYCCGREPCVGKYAEVLFGGTADETELMDYCRKNGWSFTSAGAYTDYWSDTIRRHAGSIDPRDFPIAGTSKDYELFKKTVVPREDRRGDTCQLRINCNTKENRFIGHAWCLIRSSQNPKEDQEQE